MRRHENRRWLALVGAYVLLTLGCSGKGSPNITSIGQCTPNSRFCVENSLQECNDTGTSATEVASCPNGCLQGACLDQRVCSPGERFCLNDVRKVCKPDGSGFSADASCKPGVCVNGECVNVEGATIEIMSEQDFLAMVEAAEKGTAEKGT